MRIAIQAADLDHGRIDGTRVYLLNMLRHFGKISPDDEFLIYHRKNFNPELAPPNFSNYQIKKVAFPFLWTQTRFAWELFKDKPDVLWMPMHNIPVFKSRKIKTTITIHDLAFKYFPDHFPKKDLREMNFLTDLAVRKFDKLIAISESTRKDILKFYPEIKKEKIRVIHHGFDSELFQGEVTSEERNKTLAKFQLLDSRFILYVGAIQPRKNLEVLVEAFGILKKKNPAMKLVLAGGKAWFWEKTLEKINQSPFKKDIILAGKVSFEDLVVLYRNARLFVYPSLYEGFGIPILEAQSAGIPVVAGNNSSIPEVVGFEVSPRISYSVSALLVNPHNAEEMADAVCKLISDEELRNDIINKGYENVKRFSWEKCARETLEWIKS